MTSASKDFSRLIESIAKKHMEIDNLETRNSDNLDLHQVSGLSIKRALEEAFIAGMTVGNSIAGVK